MSDFKAKMHQIQFRLEISSAKILKKLLGI